VLNEDLMGSVLEPRNVQAAYGRVKANGGAPGVDGMSVEAYQRPPSSLGALRTIRSCGDLSRQRSNRRMRKTARPVVWEG
jgi:hypothetical protein